MILNTASISFSFHGSAPERNSAPGCGEVTSMIYRIGTDFHKNNQFCTGTARRAPTVILIHRDLDPKTGKKK